MSDLNLLSPLTLTSDKTLEGLLSDVVAKTGIEDLSPSDPAYRAALGGAYSALMAYRSMDDQTRGVMLAYAVESQLDHIGSTYYKHPDGSPVVRLDGEADDDYRSRLQSSPEGLSVAGPEGSYIFHVKTSDVTIKDVKVLSPSPLAVDLYLLSSVGDGSVSPETCLAVESYLWPRRPLGDEVTARSVSIVPFGLYAELTISSAADEAALLSLVEQSLENYLESRRRIGGSVTISGVHASMMLDGVDSVSLVGWSDVHCSETEAPHRTGINMEVVGYV